jgi:hypothetical protein
MGIAAAGANVGETCAAASAIACEASSADVVAGTILPAATLADSCSTVGCVVPLETATAECVVFVGVPASPAAASVVVDVSPAVADVRVLAKLSPAREGVPGCFCANDPSSAAAAVAKVESGFEYTGASFRSALLRSTFAPPPFLALEFAAPANGSAACGGNTATPSGAASKTMALTAGRDDDELFVAPRVAPLGLAGIAELVGAFSPGFPSLGPFGTLSFAATESANPSSTVDVGTPFLPTAKSNTALRSAATVCEATAPSATVGLSGAAAVPFAPDAVRFTEDA